MRLNHLFIVHFLCAIFLFSLPLTNLTTQQELTLNKRKLFFGITKLTTGSIAFLTSAFHLFFITQERGHFLCYDLLNIRREPTPLLAGYTVLNGVNDITTCYEIKRENKIKKSLNQIVITRTKIVSTILKLTLCIASTIASGSGSLSVFAWSRQLDSINYERLFSLITLLKIGSITTPLLCAGATLATAQDLHEIITQLTEEEKETTN